jgi:phosphatidylglycerol---prolipoprotein diacylglyceryl transferase
MRPVLFQWRSFTVWSYPALVYLGLVSGVVAGNVAAHAAGIDAFRAFVATLLLIVLGLLGARFFFVLSHWQFYRGSYRLIWNRSAGGAAQYGGLLVVLPFSLFLLAVLRLPLGAFWDVTTFTLLITMIFGRIGCLMNGCCAGRPSTGWLSLYLPNRAGVWERRLPTPCLEAGWAAVLLLSAIVAWRWMPFPGALFLWVSGGYAGGRLFLESTRETVAGARKFTIHHGISVALILFSVGLLAARWTK